MNDLEFKKEFAKQWLKFPKEPFKAALVIFPTNTQRALRVANEWPFDSAVIEFKRDLINEMGEDAFLPSKAELAQKIWEKLEVCYDPGDYAKLVKVYADVRGFIEKPQTNINNNLAPTVNRVMVVRESESNDSWEKKLISQQKILTDDSN